MDPKLESQKRIHLERITYSRGGIYLFGHSKSYVDKPFLHSFLFIYPNEAGQFLENINNKPLSFITSYV